MAWNKPSSWFSKAPIDPALAARNADLETVKASKGAFESLDGAKERLKGLTGNYHNVKGLNNLNTRLERAADRYDRAIESGAQGNIEYSRKLLNKEIEAAKSAVRKADKYIGEVAKVSTRYGAALESTKSEYGAFQWGQRMGKRWLDTKVAVSNVASSVVGGVVSAKTSVVNGAKNMSNSVTKRGDVMLEGLKDGARNLRSKSWSGIKTVGKWGGIATVGAIAFGLLVGKRESQARRSQDELNNQELAALRAEQVSPMVGQNTLMGLEPTPGAMAARVRGGAEQGALNPPVDRNYQVIS